MKPQDEDRLQDMLDTIPGHPKIADLVDSPLERWRQGEKLTAEETNTALQEIQLSKNEANALSSDDLKRYISDRSRLKEISRR